MNYCKENNKYISLYIDELLDDKTKIEFLKHVDKCSECARKLEESLYFALLCREEQDIQLPENFSSSLHRRLLEVTTEEKNSKLRFFVHNKKFIASLSAAAILVISLLAYSLLPQMGIKQASTANDMAKVETSSAAADSNLYNGENKSNINTDRADGSASTDSAAASTQADITATTKDVYVKSSEAAPEASKKTARASTYTPKQEKTESGTNSKNTPKIEVTKDEVAMSIMKAERTVPNQQKYYLNFAELNLKVTPSGIEIEDLRKLMSELGAIEIKTVTISSIVENPMYIDYNLPLSQYSTLNDMAKKYNLELSKKTDIIKTDITDKYNELNTQKDEINKKIEEALEKGEDVAAFEAERTKLTEEMNKIINGKETVEVRIFFISL